METDKRGSQRSRTALDCHQYHRFSVQWGTCSRIIIRLEIIIEPDNGAFHAYCLALKGLHTCGDTADEAMENAVDAVTAYLQSVKANLADLTSILDKCIL